MIGFNKCGTTSFHSFFLKNGIASIHWRGNTLATTIYDNVRTGKRPVLQGLDHWQAYTDMICMPGTPWDKPNSIGYPVIEACEYFMELDDSYPGSLFILNTRNPSDWLESRLKHDSGRFAEEYLRHLGNRRVATIDDLKDYWLEQWMRHHKRVREYFTGALSSRFLEFRIDSDSSDVLASFLKDIMPLTYTSLPHEHKSD